MKITENDSITYMNYTGNQKKNNNSGRLRVHIGFNASGTMARIAAAKTKSQVSAIERSLRATLKEAVRYNSDDSTIRAIKKTIGKAGRKVKALGKEERMENTRKAAEGAGNIKEELRIARELTKKRNARQRKERAEIADTGSVLKSHQKREEDMYKSKESYIDVLCGELESFSDGSELINAAGEAIDICL